MLLQSEDRLEFLGLEVFIKRNVLTLGVFINPEGHRAAPGAAGKLRVRPHLVSHVLGDLGEVIAETPETGPEF